MQRGLPANGREKSCFTGEPRLVRVERGRSRGDAGGLCGYDWMGLNAGASWPMVRRVRRHCAGHLYKEGALFNLIFYLFTFSYITFRGRGRETVYSKKFIR